MKTTHELARELLAMPDVELIVEGWITENIEVVMTEYDPENMAILVNRRKSYQP